MREKLYDLLEQISNESDLECHEEIGNFMKANGINQFSVSVDEMYDSCGLDVYSVAVAWIENGELELAVSSISC